MAVQAAFEPFVFGSWHDFYMADFLPFFSVMPINLCQINIALVKMAASYPSVFLLLFLILGGRLKNLSFKELFRNVLLLLYLFWKSLDQENRKQL